MTEAERAAIEQELCLLATYVDTVRRRGAGHFVAPARPGFHAVMFNGKPWPTLYKRRRQGEERVRILAAEYSTRAGELRARILAAEWDEERAAETPGEQLDRAKAEAAAAETRPRTTYTPRHVAWNRLARRIA